MRPLAVALSLCCILVGVSRPATATPTMPGATATPTQVEPPTTTTTEPPTTTEAPTTSTPPSTRPSAPPSEGLPADAPAAPDPATLAVAKSSFLTLTDDQRALLRRLQSARDRATQARSAAMLASAVSAQLTKKLADAQAAVALADAQVETSSRRLARLQREIRSLAMALYRHLDRTEPLAAVDTARSVDLARAREYSRAPATVLDQRVAEAQTVRAGLTAARGRAVTSRDESARVSADAATAAEQLREQLAAAERADAAAMQSVIEALGSGAAVLGLVADPRFGADSITAALAITQAGQGDPVTLLGLFHTPVPGAPLGSPFGVRVDPLDGGISFHPGIDLEAGMGQPVHAAAGGTVVLSGDCGGYGNCVVIDHGHSVATLYAHQSRVLVQVGSPVADDQTIGLVGSTGKSTGPHLHFEVRLHGVPVDPLLALAA